MSVLADRRELGSLLAMSDAELATIPPRLIGPLLSQLRMTRIDALTGVANRRGIDERLAEEWSRARRHGRSLSVILLDVDDLKAINDTGGHGAGDDALRQVASGLATLLRATDLIGRSGGDEFMLVCPEADQVAVTAVAEKIGLRLHLPVSVGWATLQPDQSLQALVAKADQALYQTKASHRALRAGDGSRPAPIADRWQSNRLDSDAGGETRRARAALQTKTDFLRLAAHELRGPLTVVLGYLSLLKAGSARDLELAGIDALGLMQAKLMELERLAQQMLDVARLDDGRIQLEVRPLDLRLLVDSAVRDTVAAGADHRVQVDLPDTELLVNGNEQRLLTIVANLLSNALKYSPEGGPVECSVQADAGRARVIVRDYGIGIDAGVAERLFRPFERLQRKEAQGIAGTGLGLYLSRELARIHGGDITAEPALPNGSTFVLQLPRAGAGPLAQGI
jgi:diguanylate cyclase (GGDEF)-like protein